MSLGFYIKDFYHAQLATDKSMERNLFQYYWNFSIKKQGFESNLYCVQQNQHLFSQFSFLYIFCVI